MCFLISCVFKEMQDKEILGVWEGEGGNRLTSVFVIEKKITPQALKVFVGLWVINF